MSEPQSYPLQWPQGWPRAKFRSTSRFNSHEIHEAVSKIEDEIEKLNGKGLVISTNLKPTLGRNGKVNGPDVGAAVYFRFKDTPIALACDRWSRLGCNLWAIGCHIENLRAQERWGVGSLEQAFAGYKSLAEKAGGSLAWWQVFGYTALADVKPHEVRERFKNLAKGLHPDVGGDKDKMIELNLAFSDASRWFSDHKIAM